MKQTHIIVKPEHISPYADEHGIVTRWMHGHKLPEVYYSNQIGRVVWAKPSKAQRRLYSGAMEHVS